LVAEWMVDHLTAAACCRHELQLILVLSGNMVPPKLINAGSIPRFQRQSYHIKLVIYHIYIYIYHEISPWYPSMFLLLESHGFLHHDFIGWSVDLPLWLGLQAISTVELLFYPQVTSSYPHQSTWLHGPLLM
jgi:hypothetical protein